MMVYNTGFCPVFGNWNTIKHILENGPTLLGPLVRVNLNH
jgi:hypothetical protein